MGVLVHEEGKNKGPCTEMGVLVHEGGKNKGPCTKMGVLVHGWALEQRRVVFFQFGKDF